MLSSDDANAASASPEQRGRVPDVLCILIKAILWFFFVVGMLADNLGSKIKKKP